MLRPLFVFAVIGFGSSFACAQDAVGESYRAHLAAAESALRLGEPAEARRWLDAAPSGSRGWEWSHLDVLLDQSRKVVENLDSSVRSLALESRGDLAAVALASGRVALIDVKSGLSQRELSGHEGGAFCARFSPDGTRLVTSGVDRVARVWDVATGASLVEFKAHQFPVSSVVFSPDGARVFSSSYYTDKDTPIEGRVHLWNAETGAVLRTFKGGVKPLSSLALSADGKRIAAASWDSCVFVWRVDGPEGAQPLQLGRKPGPLQNIHINAVAFSPDSALLAAGSDHHWTKVYRVEDGAELATVSDGEADFGAVAFSPDGATLALGGDNGAVTLWNTSDWSRRATLRGHTQAVTALAWSATGRTLYSGGIERTIRAWNPAQPGYGGVRGRYGENNYSVAFSRDGRWLACASSDGTIGAIDAATGEEAFRFATKHENEVCTAAISPDGSRIGSCSWDKTFRVYDIASQKEVARVELPAGAAYFAWSPDGRRVAVALRDATAVIVDVASGAIERTLSGHSKGVVSVAWSADGARVLTSSYDASAKVWNAFTGELLVTMAPGNEKAGGHEAVVESAVFIPGTKLAATASHDGSVRVWDATTGDLVRILLTSSDSIYRVAASPDGSRLAAGGKYLYILDPLTERPLLRERPVGEMIWHLDWSPDGKRLAVGSWNGEVVVYSDSGAPDNATE
ncbi:MAG: WD40 repeat domain-containing protein [Phycisphaerales bacterium]|nr:WD40 repeat domain-containing protein [Phycisphaerales bacterium]